MRAHHVDTCQRKARAFAVKNIVTLSLVADRRTDGCAEVRAVGVIKPIARSSLVIVTSIRGVGRLPAAPEHFTEVAGDAERLQAPRIVGSGVTDHVQMSLAWPSLSGA